MSARARKRLLNSALGENPVAEETVRTYEAVLRFKENVVRWLEEQDLGEDAGLMARSKTVLLNQVEIRENITFTAIVIRKM